MNNKPLYKIKASERYRKLGRTIENITDFQKSEDDKLFTTTKHMKDGRVIEYQGRKPRGMETIPSKEQYHNTIKRLGEECNMTTLVALRMGCEMGMSRLEIVNSETENLDRFHPRGLYVSIAKKVRRSKEFKMRSREIPVNVSLYTLLKTYIDPDLKYILKRENTSKSDPMKTYCTDSLNALYNNAHIPWSTHKSRHFFKNCVMAWMRKNRCVDYDLCRHYMGHLPLDVHSGYGTFDWDYMLEVIDKTFSNEF